MKRKRIGSSHCSAGKHHPKPSYKPKPLPEFLNTDSAIAASRFATYRLPEIKSLWRSFSSAAPENNDIFAHYRSRGCTTSSRHLRRRTGSHFRRKHHRFPRSDGGETEQKTRKTRRKPSLLREKNTQWTHLATSDTVSLDNKDASSEKKWLQTHLWHTKRFYMSPPLKCFDNWCIPLAHNNRGSQAAIRLAKTKSVIQDATYTIGGRSIVLECDDREDVHLVVDMLCGGKSSLSAPFLLDQAVLSGIILGYGYVYDLSTCNYPSGLIGPSSFFFGHSSEADRFFVRITTEASIFDRVLRMARDIATAQFESKAYNLRIEPVCLLKVRGKESTKAISSSVDISTDTQSRNQSVLLWENLSKCDEIHSVLSHGTIISGKFQGAIKDDLQSHSQDCADSMSLSKRKDEVGNITSIMLENHEFNLTNEILDENSLILIGQRPNEDESDVVLNGWDILCHPNVTNEVFYSLCMIGGGCVIGYLESASLSIHSKVPITLWPRDYPDTSIGKEYYSRESNDWQVLRYCVEEGTSGGRIMTGLKRFVAKCSDPQVILGTKVRMKALNFSHITNDTKSEPVVVRGSFVAPFRNILSCYDAHSAHRVKFHEDQDQHAIRRRPRRKVKNKFESSKAPALSTDRLKLQHEVCSKMLSSLSVSALIRCYLVVEGRGTINCGSKIAYHSDSTTLHLGFVVMSSFFDEHGLVHGVGIVSANSFLNCLLHIKQGDVLVRKDNNFKPSFGIKVSVQMDDDRVTEVFLKI